MNAFSTRGAMLLLLFAAAASFTPSVRSQTFVLTKSFLPTPTKLQGAVYDGADSIYLVTPCDWNNPAKVLKYSLQAETVSTVGSFKCMDGASVVFAGMDTILLFGGRSYAYEYWVVTSEIWSYSISSNSSRLVNHLPGNMSMPAVAWDAARQVAYVVSEDPMLDSDQLVQYNLAQNKVEVLSDLPSEKYSTVAAWDDKASAVYYFRQRGNALLIRYDQAQKTGSVVKDSRASSDEFWTFSTSKDSCAVYAESNGKLYVVANGYKQPSAFNTADHSFKTLNIPGYYYFHYRAGCVFVPKLKRIYLFGGNGQFTSGQVAKDRREISYLDLTAA